MTKQFEIESDDERLIVFVEGLELYGLLDRKDHSGCIPIGFCPWCGARLPLPSQFESDTPFESKDR